MPSETDLFRMAVEHHQAGRLSEAEAIYRQILAQNPNHPHSLHHLGAIAHQTDHNDAAVELMRRAIAVNPDDFAAHHNLGEVYRKTGRLQEAVACHRRSLALNPDFAQAHDHLGLTLLSLGEIAQARDCHARAAQLMPQDPEIQLNLGFASQLLGDLQQAEACYCRVLEINAGHVTACNNLGMIHQQQGRFGRAIDCYRRALALQPDNLEALNNVGYACQQDKRPDQAIAYLQQALRLKPDFPHALNNLGNTLADLERLDEATEKYLHAIELMPGQVDFYVNLGRACCRKWDGPGAEKALQRALALDPQRQDALAALGTALQLTGKPEEAMACFRRAISLRPDDVDSLISLGVCYLDQFRSEEAAECFERALRIKPRSTAALVNMGVVMLSRADVGEAIVYFRRALDIDPQDDAANDNLIYNIHFHPDFDAQAIYVEHRRWEERCAIRLREYVRPHDNDRSPERKLRLGYVSPDFRNHVVGLNVLPVLSRHDHDRFEVFCYMNLAHGDPITGKFQKCADGWRQIAALDNAQAAQLIRDDHIDVLVDLSLHMSGSRPLLFAHKPAPVQVTWAGYPGTTGMQAIDYRLTDPYLDPPGQHDRNYSEESFCLPNSFWCFQEPAEAPPVGPLPCRDGRSLTFGCFNNFTKVNPPLLRLWARILVACPGSRLILLANLGGHRQRTIDALHGLGVEADRVTFVGRMPRPEYFAQHNQLDLIIDTFPYTGHSTTLDALWMGVPVVSLAGETAVSRGGLSILSNVGLADLVAANPDDFVAIAIKLAQDRDRLANLRQSLRDRMRASPLMDLDRFTRNVESAYREMWVRWCRRP
jgi:protein O-GlcNAc transferase